MPFPVLFSVIYSLRTKQQIKYRLLHSSFKRVAPKFSDRTLHLRNKHRRFMDLCWFSSSKIDHNPAFVISQSSERSLENTIGEGDRVRIEFSRSKRKRQI